MKLKLLSYVMRSKQRQMILSVLDSPKTPTQISQMTKLSTAHVSRTLKEFCKKNIAKCETPKEKVGRIYILTRDGKKLLDTFRK